MNILMSTRSLGVCAAVALLAGCNSGAGNDTPSQGGRLGPDSNGATRTVAHGFTELQRCKNCEKLTSTSGSGNVVGCSANVIVSGQAVGAYPGTFTGGGQFGLCNSGPLFGGSFAITSGANKITGSFFGEGQGSCGRGGCFDGGKLTYKATLEPGGKTFSGNGSGEIVVRGTAGSMELTLHSM
jgi:hypothetical protein